MSAEKFKWVIVCTASANLHHKRPSSESFTTSIMTFTPQLPPEIWIEIFRTIIIAQNYNIQTDDYSSSEDADILAASHSRRSVSPLSSRLILVCKLWHSLAKEIVYEEIRVKKTNRALLEALERQAKPDGLGYGKFTRLVELPREYQYTFDVTKHLPQLEKLIISSPSPFSPLSPSGPLPEALPFHEMSSLKQIDWTCDRNSGPRLDYLEDLLQCSPNLQHLSLIGEEHFTSPRMTYPINLPSLKFLYVSGFQNRWRLSTVISKWTLPSLTHITLDSCGLNAQEGLWIIWQTFGPTLRIVELGKKFPIYRSLDHVSNILSLCTSLNELCLSIEFFFLRSSEGGTSSSINTIRLNSRHSTAVWELLEVGFKRISLLQLSSLDRIILQGAEWLSTMNNTRFAPCRQIVFNRRWALELESHYE